MNEKKTIPLSNERGLYTLDPNIDYALGTFIYPGLPGVKRLGYRGFLSAVWILWKMNRNAKKLRITTECRIRLPIRWLR